MEQLRRQGYPPGEQCAFVVVRVLSEDDMVPMATTEEALDWMQSKRRPDLDVLIVLRALLALPMVGP